MYVSHFCTRRPTAIPYLHIKFQKQISILGFAIIASAIVVIPSQVSAFWPFFSNAGAATNSAIIPRASTPVLVAPINSNPNSGAPVELVTSNGSALISYGGPAGTLADVSNSIQSGQISIYYVRSGDTLSEIADMFGVSVNTIIWANNLSSSKDVHPGDTLVILPISGIERTVVKGDTLKSLAKKYAADANEIAQFNGLDPTEPLAIGSKVIIPGGEIAVPVTPSAPRRTVNNPYIGGGGDSQPGYYSNPVPGAIITQGIHGWNGVDIGAARGTPIHAATDGTVIIARSNGAWNGGYGNYVVITHNNGSQTLYSHMSSVITYPGRFVLSGQVIGYVGSTGQSTGPHLHFEVRGAANPFRNCRIGGVCYPQ